MQSFPLLPDPTGKPDLQANFGPLSRGSFSNPMLITVLDTHMTTRSPGSDSEDPSDSECSTLTRFSMNLVYKSENLKEPQDIKEQVNTKIFL